MLVREIARWREDVERDAPDCLASFDALVLEDPEGSCPSATWSPVSNC